MLGDLPGVMSDIDLSDLNRAAGTSSDEMPLTMTIEHHEGAIDMTKTAKAHAIIKTEAAEVATMKRWPDPL
jgi:uncharacterized protein (DUF305 family)